MIVAVDMLEADSNVVRELAKLMNVKFSMMAGALIRIGLEDLAAKGLP